MFVAWRGIIQNYYFAIGDCRLIQNLPHDYHPLFDKHFQVAIIFIVAYFASFVVAFLAFPSALVLLAFMFFCTSLTPTYLLVILLNFLPSP